jgi:hypothetical protein
MNKLKTILIKVENSFYAEKFKEFQGDQRQTWPIMNRLLNKGQSSTSNVTKFYYQDKSLTGDFAIALQ